MRFLEATDLIKIEDILPFFPDFVVIDEFKEEICTALESCGSQIASLKAEMDEATRSAKSIQQDIDGLQNRFVTVDGDEVCQRCEEPVMKRMFYVFACGHSFHADCLVAEVSK